MAYKIPNPPAGFDNLSPEEQIDYVQSLWARVAATPEKVPVPDWHLAILDQRLKEHDDE
ncbi:addiction module protein [Candidatus Sumerlaeota bacterium]|nr:addiction module protein [Candidatus Sumerlaeota bacterium]MBI3735857.1 addiction module protein [Candidatus Sumerlaeota bacterium]